MKINNHNIILSRVKTLSISLLALVFFFSACGRKPPQPNQTPVETASLALETADIEPTMLPSPTPEPKRVILFTPAGANPDLAASVESVLRELAANSGMEFEKRTELAGSQLEGGIRLVAAVPPDPGLSNLASANPSIQFLAVGMENLLASPNLSLIGGNGSSPDQIGFLAGYLASVITTDWRVGVIRSVEGIEGKTAGNGFKNGVIFFCGLCRPAYPPFVQYPVVIDLPIGAGEAEIRSAADQLSVNGVKTVFLTPGVDVALVSPLLAKAGIKLIGVSAPPEEVKPAWVATIKFDPADTIRQVWQQLIEGSGDLNQSASLAIVDVNRDNLSQGRQQWVERLLAEMAGGYIDTGVDPQTGEFR